MTNDIIKYHLDQALNKRGTKTGTAHAEVVIAELKKVIELNKQKKLKLKS